MFVYFHNVYPCVCWQMLNLELLWLKFICIVCCFSANRTWCLGFSIGLAFCLERSVPGKKNVLTFSTLLNQTIYWAHSNRMSSLGNVCTDELNWGNTQFLFLPSAASIKSKYLCALSFLTLPFQFSCIDIWLSLKKTMIKGCLSVKESALLCEDIKQPLAYTTDLKMI